MTIRGLGQFSAALVLLMSGGLRAAESTAADLEFFEKRIRPVLAERCYECHSGEKPKDGVGFDHMDELIKTEGKRAVVMKGDPAKSTMFSTIMKADDSKKRMPPPKKGARLTPEQVGIIQAWIKEGAKIDA